MGRVDVEKIPYEDYSNRQLAAIPLAILALAILVVLGAYFITGAPADLGMVFTGGTEIRFEADAGTADIRSSLSDVESDSIISVGLGSGEYELSTQATNTEEITDRIEEEGYNVLSVESRSADFGSNTQGEALFGLLLAFVGMSLLIALIFRSFIPSLAIVASAFSDIVIPLALMNILGIELNLGTVAALLMIIGYSVDSDILLNNHVLKRHGDFYDSSFRAMRTGVSMTLTSIAAMATMWLVATLLGIPLLPDVGIVLIFGLTADLFNTYMLNMSLLRWYKYEGVKR